MKASELKVGESCRYGFDGCTRVEHEGEKVALVSHDFKLSIVDPDQTVYSAFDFEGMKRPVNDDDWAGHAIDCFQKIDSLSSLDPVKRRWEIRMKELAAVILKPGSGETIDDMYALDYVWELPGDYSFSFDGSPWHLRALDYYLGRKVEHAWGVGTLMKIADGKIADHYVKDFGEDKVYRSNPDSLYPLPARGIHYGIKIDFPCQCGKVKYEMFAIPGVHLGGFAYLVDEQTDARLDVRNHCRVCDECAPIVRSQLAALGD